MCGIAGIVGPGDWEHQIGQMVEVQKHRGPDAAGIFVDPSYCWLGHNRLSIIDLGQDGNQPMSDDEGRYTIVFNGEIYNYRELKVELGVRPRTSSDTEILLHAFKRWGEGCVGKLIGMFAFAVWDSRQKCLFAARDRFGVKPFYYYSDNGSFRFASEIKTLWASGVPKIKNQSVWASYFTYGSYGMPDETFWSAVKPLPAGHSMKYSQAEGLSIASWYSFAERVAEVGIGSISDFKKRYVELLEHAVTLRFRSDVPVGFNLSGGLDSSLLLGLVDSNEGTRSGASAYTFVTGDTHYDELPWVSKLLQSTSHPLRACLLDCTEVPSLATKISSYQDEPYGGLPTIAYSKIFEQSRKDGVTVLLDGQGMDEVWAGYDYYSSQSDSLVQGTSTSPVRPNCLVPEFLREARRTEYPQPFTDQVKNLQFRDLLFTKIPRTLRFNDRISMMHSTELREPFLDHRIVELAFALPTEHKLVAGRHKALLREIASNLLAKEFALAPKRPVQTPQREWLANDLRDWTSDMVELTKKNEWFDGTKVEAEYKRYLEGFNDNSFYIWQWINANLLLER